MRDESEKITVVCRSGFNDFTTSATDHQVREVGDIEITFFPLRVMTGRTSLFEDRFCVVIERDPGGWLFLGR